MVAGWDQASRVAGGAGLTPMVFTLARIHVRREKRDRRKEIFKRKKEDRKWRSYLDIVLRGVDNYQLSGEPTNR